MLENLPDVIGVALRDQRAGLDKIAFNQIGLRQGAGAITVSSLAFADHAPIPADYTADGPGLSPPLQWSGVPPGTASVALIVEDADAPTPQPLVHAIVVELEGADGALGAGALPSPGHEAEADVTPGRNSFLRARWLPPDPPPGHGTHRYVFQVFALAPGPALAGTPGRGELLDALRERAVAGGYLVGTFTRPDGSIPLKASAVVTPVQPG